MDVKQIDVGLIKAYAKNAKKHPEEQVKAIANSIREFGFRQPLVLDKNMEIIVGHGRLAAAKLLGMTSVPVVMADDLTEEQVKAFRLADNKTNESDWDFNLLAEEIGDLPNLDLTDFGFNEAEILELTIDDTPEEIPKEPVAQTPYYQQSSNPLVAGDLQEYSGQPYETPVEYQQSPSNVITRTELEEYESHANSMDIVTRRVIIVFKTEEEEAFIRSLLNLPEQEKLGVIYLAEKLMKERHAEEG